MGWRSNLRNITRLVLLYLSGPNIQTFIISVRANRSGPPGTRVCLQTTKRAPELLIYMGHDRELNCDWPDLSHAR